MPPLRKQQPECPNFNGLAPGRSVTGAPYDLRDYKYFMAGVYSEEDGKLKIEESAKKNNWDLVHAVDVDGGTGESLIVEVVLKWARVKYTNGSNHSNQFRMYSVYKKHK